MNNSITIDLLKVANSMPEIYTIAQLQESITKYVGEQTKVNREKIEFLSMVFALQGMIKEEGYETVKREIELTQQGGNLLRSVKNTN